MKKTIRLSLIAASVLALTACNQEAKKEQAEVKLDTVEQQQAYGIGASVGNFLNKDLADKTEIGIELDQALLIRGFEDALAGNAKIDEEKIREVLTALDTSVRTKLKLTMVHSLIYVHLCTTDTYVHTTYYMDVYESYTHLLCIHSFKKDLDCQQSNCSLEKYCFV